MQRGDIVVLPNAVKCFGSMLQEPTALHLILYRAAGERLSSEGTLCQGLG
jgi:hypothetical protein